MMKQHLISTGFAIAWAAGLLAPSGFARDSLSHPRAHGVEMTQVYHDLPGVRDPDTDPANQPVVCSSQTVSSGRPYDRLSGGSVEIHSCTQGGITVGSQTSRPSVYRSLRGIGW